MLYKEMRKKELIKNTIYICFILLLAIIPTYFIYYKFQDDRSIESNSESLDVTYLEKTGDKISITKVTPVTDSVGLSSKNYIINIKNNLTEKVGYRIKIEDDLETIKKDNCEEKLISKSDIRISVKVGKDKTEIYTLEELENGIIIENIMEALDKTTIAIRVWVSQESSLPLGAKMHYHSIMKVEEDNSIISKLEDKKDEE